MTETNLMIDIKQALIIVISIGFASGVVYGVIDELSELLIKSREIKLVSAVRKCLVIGLTEAASLGVITFVLISTTSISLQAIIQSIVGIAVSFAVIGSIFIKLFDLILSKLFSPHQQ
jgi:hypothetical protein